MAIDITPYTHAVALTLASSGLVVDVWDEYAVVLDMLAAGNPWSFAFWRSDPVDGQTTGDRSTTWSVLRRNAKLGGDVMLSIDGAAQLNGRIETMDAGGGREGVVLVLGGRDIAGPAMDCDVDPTLTIRNTPFGDALTQLFRTIGVTTRVTSSAANVAVTAHESPGPRRTRAAQRNARVDIAHPRPGEKVWAFAESMARRVGYLLWVAPDADRGLAVVADVPNDSATPSYVLMRREVPNTSGADFQGNILTGHERLNLRGVPTTVTVYSGTDRGAATSARTRSYGTNVAITDPVVTRGLVVDPVPEQPRHIRSPRARTPQRAAQDAANVTLDGMRNFRVYECTVRGHGQTVDGEARLYALNTVARVRDDVCIDAEGRPLDEDMLIVKVEFRYSKRAGTTTTLTLVPRGALVLVSTET